jgi:hypothetical protein
MSSVFAGKIKKFLQKIFKKSVDKRMNLCYYVITVRETPTGDKEKKEGHNNEEHYEGHRQ